MAAVDVGIGHRDDAVVAQFFVFETFADTSAQSGDQVPDLLRREHFVEAGFFHVEDLSAQGQDGLVAPIAAGFCGASGGVALDDEKLAVLWVAI